MQKLQLTIPEPCHENWQQMTPTDQGRFCNACAKEVIDFSMMTDTEVLNYFTSLTHDNVCGRALPSQLERTISKQKDPKKKLFWYWNYIVMFFMFFGKGNSAKAQGAVQQITNEQLNLIKQTNINNALAGKVGQVAVTHNRVITGKITDIDGNPVSFASVKIKGTAKGISADANGKYSIKANSNALLVISGASFKEAEVLVGTQKVLNTVMEKSGVDIKEVVVTVAGGVMRRPASKAMTESKDTASTIKSVVIFEVKEDNTGLPIDKAAITITRKGDNLSEKSFSDKKGIYKYKQIKLNDSFFVKVESEGYEPSEFTITGIDFKDKKKNWVVLLRRQKVAGAVSKSSNIARLGKETIIKLGQVSANIFKGDPLYVVDGIIMPSTVDINPDDIEDVTILQAPKAMLIFGSQASYGAIVITTRKAKEIKMKEVIVTSENGIKGALGMLGGIGYTNTYEDSFLGDTIATLKTLLTDSIKVYPNPVQRNNSFSVALKLKQASNYRLQVTDASGSILLLQKFNAGSKEHTEKIMSDSRWAGGAYYIRVFDAQNKLISKSSFIVQ